MRIKDGKFKSFPNFFFWGRPLHFSPHLVGQVVGIWKRCAHTQIREVTLSLSAFPLFSTILILYILYSSPLCFFSV